MVELVDTLVLGTSAFGRGGSTPSRGTHKKIDIYDIFNAKYYPITIFFKSNFWT